MKPSHFLCAALIAAVSLPAMAQDIVPAPVAPREMPASFADLVEKLSPAVVNISTTQKVKGGQALQFGMPFQQFPDAPELEPFREFFERFGQMQGQPAEREVYSLGSGFVIDPAGYVITNNHVIDEAEEIHITFSDNSKYKATVVGRDPKTDLALLKIEGKKPFPAVVMGDSDAMRTGDWIVAIGNPYGLGGSVTAGIISARARSINAGPFDDFLQTDASINRGNSGGPLFNMKGEVIGIASAIFSPSGGSIGIGFAIPTALARPVVEQLKKEGRVRRGWLGVKIQEVSDEIAESVGLAKEAGALVLEVSPGSPAAKAGLQAGDVITAFNGKEVNQMRHLPRLVAEAKAGSTATLTYWRKNASHTATVTIAELEEEGDKAEKPRGQKKLKEGKPEPAVLGMALSGMTPELRRELQLGEKVGGVVVTDVAAGSEAAKRGLQPGDVLLDVGGEKVSAPAEFKSALAKARKAGRKFALVKLLHGKDEAFVTLPTSETEKKE